MVPHLEGVKAFFVVQVELLQPPPHQLQSESAGVDGCVRVEGGYHLYSNANFHPHAKTLKDRELGLLSPPARSSPELEVASTLKGMLCHVSRDTHNLLEDCLRLASSSVEVCEL